MLTQHVSNTDQTLTIPTTTGPILMIPRLSLSAGTVRDSDVRTACETYTDFVHQYLEVLKTLIRCHFSPPGSTDSRYVYSGSYDGSVYIWNMDATLAGKVNVLKATKNSRPRDPDLLAETYDYWGRNGGSWMTCVRDASWHPTAPMIAGKYLSSSSHSFYAKFVSLATSWNGWGTSQGTCTVHSWNDGVEEDEAEPKIGRRVNAQLQHDERLYRSAEGRSRRQPMWYDDMMDDD